MSTEDIPDTEAGIDRRALLAKLPLGAAAAGGAAWVAPSLLRLSTAAAQGTPPGSGPGSDSSITSTTRPPPTSNSSTRPPPTSNSSFAP